MGFFDFFESAMETVSSVAGGVVDAAGSVASGVVDVAGSAVNVVVENPGKVLLVVGGATAVLAAPVVVAGTGLAGAASSVLSAVTGAGCTTIGLSTTTKAAVLAAAELTAKSTMLQAFAGKQIGEHVIDNYIRDIVKPAEGSIIYCDLGVVVEHSGIYIGNGRIVHLDGSGKIEIVTREEFIGRLGGANVAMSVYVSCSDSCPTGKKIVAERAIDMVGKTRNYNLVFNNCHQFTSGCVTGDFENADNFLWMLKHTAEKKYNTDSWRVWG